MTDPASIVAAALALKGTPYHHQSRLPGPRGGLDCAGVVVCAHRAAGLEVHDSLRYARRPNPRELLAHLGVSFERVPEADMRPGDVPLFFYRRRRRTREPMPQHMAILVPKADAPDGLGLLHAYEEQRARFSFVTLVDFDATWRERLDSVWRHRGAC